MIVYESPEAILEWDEQKNVVVLTWQGAAYGKALRTPIEKLLELVTSKQKKGWVVDLSKIGGVSKEDQEWYDQDFLPRATSQGIKRIGTTVPKSAVAQLSAAKYVADTDKAGIWVKYFTDIDEAKEWLSKV
jgi:hypothetical protein